MSLELGGNPWTCDCGLVTVYRVEREVRGEVRCHHPPGITLTTANMTSCTTETEEEARDLVIVTVVVTVAVILLLTVVGVLGCRYQDQLLYLVPRLGKCPQQESLQPFQDTEEFLHFSPRPVPDPGLSTRPVPVTEL